MENGATSIGYELFIFDEAVCMYMCVYMCVCVLVFYVYRKEQFQFQLHHNNSNTISFHLQEKFPCSQQNFCVVHPLNYQGAHLVLPGIDQLLKWRTEQTPPPTPTTQIG